MGSAPRIGAAPANPAPDPLPPSYVPQLSVDRLSGGTISGAVIEVGDDGVIKAGLGSTTVELVREGLFGYIDDVEVFHLADGELFVKGTIEADDGYFAGELNGAHIFGSTIDASTFTGGTIAIGTGDAVFRASNLGIQLGSGDWLTAPFKVDATGRLTATQATISGTIQTATSGPRMVLTQSQSTADYGYGPVLQQWGTLQFFSDVTGETPATIEARSTGTPTTSSKAFTLTTGVDGRTNTPGPVLRMSIGDDPYGGYQSQTTLDSRVVTVSGALHSTNERWAVDFVGTVADHWVGDSPLPGSPYPGSVAVWKDVVGALHLQGAVLANANWINGTRIATTVAGYRPNTATRSVIGHVNGVTPVELEWHTNGDLICKGSVAAGNRVELNAVLPVDFQPFS